MGDLFAMKDIIHSGRGNDLEIVGCRTVMFADLVDRKVWTDPVLPGELPGKIHLIRGLPENQTSQKLSK